MTDQSRQKVFQGSWVALDVDGQACSIVADETGEIAGRSQAVDVGSEPHALNCAADRDHPPLDHLIPSARRLTCFRSNYRSRNRPAHRGIYS